MGKIFKDYCQGQMMLLPPSLDDLIASGHPVRVVNDIIDRLELGMLMSKYKGGGTTSYHPRMLLKVLVYGYLSNVYSSRKLESAVCENIHFMWLSGMQRPDHNTINRFRSERLKEVVREVFTQVVLLLHESGHLSLQSVFTDGTKIEANANRYTFVWGKRITKSKEKMEQKLRSLWEYAESVAAEELKDQRPTTFEPVDPEQVQETLDKIHSAIGGKKKDVDPKKRQELNRVRKAYPSKLAEYQQQEAILNGRNSYSKTDPDATFMRMKEDHMRNGQLKPGYNLQISTSDQYILHYSIHHNPTDTTTLIPHLKGFKQAYKHLPDEITADAGYGSQENYAFLENNGVAAYVKYNSFDHAKSRKGRKKKEKRPFTPENLHYNAEENYLVCPMGQRMDFVGTKTEKTATGFERTSHLYRAKRCEGCPLRGTCHKSKHDRTAAINFENRRFRQKAKELLDSEQGKERRSQRPVDVEPVFGHIKSNRNYRRFLMRGREKVEIETGLLAIAHNIAKSAKDHTPPA